MDIVSIFVGFMLVFMECFIPVLPLSVFVAFNVNTFGFFLGFLISWIATCIGSYICYLCFYYIGDCFFKIKTLNRIQKSFDRFQTISFTELVLLITLPFSPSSFFNMMTGLTKISRKKYFFALLIGKSFSIMFWSYIGKSVFQSLTDYYSIIYIIITLLLAYVLSKMVSNRMCIE